MTRYEYALLRDFCDDLSDRLSRKYYAVPFFTKTNLNIHTKSARVSSVAVFYTEKMLQSKKRVHIFNCDNTYKLEPVEKLLEETKKKLPEKLSIHVEPVEKHSFRLAQMSEMVEKIRTLEMDMAFFVVHANESRLSINEDNAGIGYAKIYRALLQATGKKRKYFITQSHFFERISLLLITHFSASWAIFEKGSGDLVQTFSIFP